MHRKLPVYLLLDTSGSMAGEPIEAVKNGVQLLVSTLRQDPHALETAYLSIIGFGSDASVLVPLSELAAFQPPPLTASGTTSMGQALKLLATQIDAEVTRTSADTKGDWKPLVFLMTDGMPTDNWQSGLDELRKRKVGTVVACAAGQQCDEAVLKQITEIVVRLDTADSSTIAAFFKWVSASISTGSQRVDAGGKEVTGIDDLPPPPKEINLVV
ncbi:vWA domain-containing protein [Thermomonas paludicola]|uniref:vWA domain-containing protein n=1 Tax=Thermomonas paludicola TaxID=2884874 RepID=UPI00211494EB|nr:VWA domain-containing protein [Thermomonas paludicola]